MAGSRLSQEIAERNAPREQAAGPKTMEAALTAMAPEFQKVLPRFLTPDTFLRLALNEIRATPTLAQCTVPSFMGALMLGARLGLEPGGPLGQLYLTPRNLKLPGTGGRNQPAPKYALQVVPIIGYRGLRDLAIRSGRVDSIQSFIVREGDEFRFGSNEERGPWHEWVPADTDEDESDRPWKGVLTVAHLGVGKKPVWRYLSRKAVLDRKSKGDAGDRGPWKDFEEAMVRKTGIRAIANDLPSSSVLVEAVRSDERVMVWHQGDSAPQAAQQIGTGADTPEQPNAAQGAETTPQEQGQPEPPPPEEGASRDDETVYVQQTPGMPGPPPPEVSR